VSDTRFTLLGIGLIFAGFLVLGIFGPQFFEVTIQAEEFDTCYEYFDDRPPVPVECDVKLQNKAMFSGLVIGLIVAGVVSLVKGVRGKWDQDVKPEDMVGPGGPSYPSSDESKSFGKKD
jgi:hypothetical protein